MVLGGKDQWFTDLETPKPIENLKIITKDSVVSKNTCRLQLLSIADFENYFRLLDLIFHSSIQQRQFRFYYSINLSLRSKDDTEVK